MTADNGSATIAVVLGGTAIPLPNNKTLNGFTAAANNQAFTAQQAGTYLISYQINLTAALMLTSGVTVNGVLFPASVITATAATNTYTNTFIATLAVGDVLSLQLSGLLGAAVLQGGSGAALNIVRLT